jgi:hypothetical protein
MQSVRPTREPREAFFSHSLTEGFDVIALAVLVLVSVPSFAWAQTQPSRKGVRVEVGFSDNHDGLDRSFGGAIRAFGIVDRVGLVSVEGGALAGMPYLGGDGGVNVRFPVRRSLSVLVRGGAGVLFEEDFIGPFWRYGGGIELLVTASNRITFTYQRGGHGDGLDNGPHLLMVGWERRVGRR